MKAMVAVLDFGGQYNQLIARRVRELHVYSEMVPYDIELDKLQKMNPQGIIFSGGPASVYEKGAPQCDPGIFEMGIPILGICYGMQLIAKNKKGLVEDSHIKEYGRAYLNINSPDGLFKDINSPLPVWMSHGVAVKRVPEGFEIMAATDNCPIAAMGDYKNKLYGVQFHPEVRHTHQGNDILGNFLFSICRIKPDWDLQDYITSTIEAIRRQVGDNKVLCALSGGVDSSVAAVMTYKAVGQKLICVYVDTGLMRKHESEQVKEIFANKMGMELVFVDARDRFFNKLAGVRDPEQKRKIIGAEFIRVFEEEARKFGEINYLVQGTIYPDVVESGTKTANIIKSHHNVGGLPEDMEFELVEPLRLLFKDEVRAIGTELGMSDEIVWRQPFPGPGLGVRVLEEVTHEKVSILQEADYIVQEEIRKAGLEREIWQAFAVLPPIRSVGVMGDDRTYSYPVIIRAVNSDDAMTAEWSRLPYEVLDKIALRIVNEVKGINRVAYDITSKPPGTIEWE
ncbi:MAG: glutamine-hydrolyzing GMP synthase [Syntrophomonadaceae bacterium]|jgi:GMP synthase (glutamine-hydrolysing)|nr:glutamine-hydrolyzing GMP synthase [Syntrophomonadaceae bacterium]